MLSGSDACASFRARPVGALLMTSVHGIVAMENSGQLTPEKWHVTGDELLRMLIDQIAAETPADLPH